MRPRKPAEGDKVQEFTVSRERSYTAGLTFRPFCTVEKTIAFFFMTILGIEGVLLMGRIFWRTNVSRKMKMALGLH